MKARPNSKRQLECFCRHVLGPVAAPQLAAPERRTQAHAVAAKEALQRPHRLTARRPPKLAALTVTKAAQAQVEGSVSPGGGHASARGRGQRW